MFIPLRTFAGHNKWSKIRHKKGAKDKARAAILGKASLAITAAAKDCGGDLSNLRLQSCITHAKSVQLPKDRIEEAIAKATSKGSDGIDLVNLRYDAMIQMGGTKVACVITALTDNHKRTFSDVRHLITKHGNGEIMPTDNLAYIFDHVGQVEVEGVEDEDALFDCALEAGAINVEEQPQGDNEDTATDSLRNFVVTTDEKDLWQVVKALQELSYNVVQFEHRYILQDADHGGVELSSDGEEQLLDFLERMDENEDVTNVYHNVV